ncbi:uncharacterized protein vir-1 [Tribolium castaneum]|uniref:Icarapin-like n=1 Tax=Tribolium castaneum TaxID=7070 RepID=D1ZZD5_TRICA|nr:PREDICTED: uncharacterized protein LOC658984 [Tribolium castaneum]EFA02354.1 Icarapin-like [Tribolium castaneum]|eukprot:XP_966682.1 PREDICTED: uncharacterized protein LOC658984 [Tribolium castaneum]
MRVTGVVVALAFLAAVCALPAKKDEVEYVPLEEQGGGGIVDTGVIGGGPWLRPFDGLFESLAGMMARMRQQMEYLLNRLPVGNHTGVAAPFPGFPDIDLGKGNTTSVTKVIDGHKVVINETEYKHEGDLGGAFFKVRIIDVLPDSSELTTEKNAEEITTKDIESVESSFENEIPKNKEIEVFKGETFDEPDGEWSNLETMNSIEDNAIDLSRDTYVNQVLADAGAPTNPDAEVFAIESKTPFEKITSPR